MANMIRPVIIALPFVGAVVNGFWRASALGIAATWPRRTDRTSGLDPDHAGESATGDGGP
jgi:hypothetical protein